MSSDFDRRTIPESSTKQRSIVLDSLDSPVWVILQSGCRDDADGVRGVKWIRDNADRMLSITIVMVNSIAALKVGSIHATRTAHLLILRCCPADRMQGEFMNSEKGIVDSQLQDG